MHGSSAVDTKPFAKILDFGRNEIRSRRCGAGELRWNRLGAVGSVGTRGREAMHLLEKILR